MLRSRLEKGKKMGIEIERKFLIIHNDWPRKAGKHYRQGYISSDPRRVVRVRVVGDTGFLTIKGELSGCSCPEYEYLIPEQDARKMLESLCVGSIIEKKRYQIPFEGFVWAVDVFERENSGLILAEVELSSEEEKLKKPDWIGEEVTGDKRFYNAYLSRHPYSEWGGW